MFRKNIVQNYKKKLKIYFNVKNGPITSTLGKKIDYFFIESQKCDCFLELHLVIHLSIFFAHLLAFKNSMNKFLNDKR